MFHRLMVLLGLAMTLITASAAHAERRVALVIGNAAYSSAASLRNPRNDANDMAETLKKLGFEVQLGLDLDQKSFASTIEDFARALDGADVGLFFYAGHGLQLNDKNYLVSVNARLENEFLLAAETMDLTSIVRLMESKAAVNLVFLDACRNNPLAENLRRGLEATKRSAALGRGLARVDPTSRDTLIAFAAAPGQVAADGNDRNSPFTASLLRNIPRPKVEVSVMLKEVSADVRRATANAQRPQQLSDMSRTFYFAAEPAVAEAPAPAAKAAAAPAGDDRALDVAFWSAAQSANDCEFDARLPAAFPERRLRRPRAVGRAPPVSSEPPGHGGGAGSACAVAHACGTAGAGDPALRAAGGRDRNAGGARARGRRAAGAGRCAGRGSRRRGRHGSGAQHPAGARPPRLPERRSGWKLGEGHPRGDRPVQSLRQGVARSGQADGRPDVRAAEP